MPADDELEALRKIADALEPLNDEARLRALQWAIGRFRGNRVAEVSAPKLGTELTMGDASSESHESFAELFEAGNPATEREKALLAAYWAQVSQNQASFAAQTLNSDLKDLGHGVGNITEALTALKNERPALVLQLKKSGTSKQARKTYKLTLEGIKRVQSMMRNVQP